MRNFLYAARQVFRFKGANFVKLISLTLGLVAGGTFAARVAFEQSYDNFLPDLERIYRLEIDAVYGERVFKNETGIVAPMTPAITAATPNVESGTRFMGTWQSTFSRGDKFYKLGLILVDSCFFDVLDFGVISGNPKQELAVPCNAFISEEFAENIFGKKDPAGEILTHADGYTVTIRGVFRNVPANSHLRFDIVIANPEPFRARWDGGASYDSYFKLHNGVTASQVDDQIPAVIAAHMDIEQQKAKGIVERYHLEPLRTIATREFAQIDLIMSLLAFVLIAVGALNYVLMTISSLSSRSKEIGVHKASGARNGGIFALILWETFIYVVLAIGLGFVLMIIFQSQIEDVAGSFASIFSLANLWALLIVVALLFLIAGVIPAWMFSRIPVSQIFRRYTDHKNSWKRALLFFQFTSSAFVLAFLMIIILQHNKMMNSNTGYNYENVAFAELEISADTKEPYLMAAAEIERLPFVKRVALGNNVPSLGYNSGIGVNNIEKDEMLFTCGKFETEPRFFDLFEIPILRGRNFLSESDSTICIVDQSTAQQFSKLASADVLNYVFRGDGDVRTVGGVAADIKFGSFRSSHYPMIYTHIEGWYGINLFMKLDELTPANLKAIDKRLRELFPRTDFEIRGYGATIKATYEPEEKFRDGVVIASIVLVIITVIGVVGYTATETRRRSREVAIRKIHGATSSSVIRLMMRGVTMLCGVASAVGVAAAYLLGELWLQSFYTKTPLYWWIFIAAAGLIILLVVSSVVLQTWRIARENPARSIKTE